MAASDRKGKGKYLGPPPPTATLTTRGRTKGKSAPRITSWIITCFDYHEWNQWYQAVTTEGHRNRSWFRGIIWQPELGSEQQGKHIQAVVQLTSPVTAARLQQLLPPLRIWKNGLRKPVDVRRAVSYCSDTKKTRFPLDGDDTVRAWPSTDAIVTQGHRSDLWLMMRQAQVGATDQELFTSDTGNTYARFWRHAIKAREISLEAKGKEDRVVKVYALCGDAGSGKSYKARHDYGEVYTPSAGRGGEPWWCGYAGEKTILLEDFDGDDTGMSFRTFRRITDVYPLTIQTKGGQTHACWTTIVITSNKAPDQWFGQDFYPRSLSRRLTEVTVWEGEYPDTHVSPWTPPGLAKSCDF